MLSQMNIFLNVHFPERTFGRMDISPKTYFPELTLPGMYIWSNGHFPENLFSRMDTCQNVLDVSNYYTRWQNKALRSVSRVNICFILGLVLRPCIVRFCIVLRVRDGNRSGRPAPVGSRFFDRPVRPVEKPVEFSFLATKRHLITNRNILIYFIINKTFYKTSVGYKQTTPFENTCWMVSSCD